MCGCVVNQVCLSPQTTCVRLCLLTTLVHDTIRFDVARKLSICQPLITHLNVSKQNNTYMHPIQFASERGHASLWTPMCSVPDLYVAWLRQWQKPPLSPVRAPIRATRPEGGCGCTCIVRLCLTSNHTTIRTYFIPTDSWSNIISHYSDRFQLNMGTYCTCIAK